MNILSRRKRLLNRTPKAPKMSSRRQFHRALRRHPAWPLVMAEAAVRAKAHKEQEAARAKLQKEAAKAAQARARANWGQSGSFPSRWLGRLVRRNRPGVIEMSQRSSRTKLRRALRRNRALVVSLLAVGGLVAALTGISLAIGKWQDGPASTDIPLSARFGAAAAYDVANDEMLIFGGFGGANGSAPVLGDTWAFKPRYFFTDEEWLNRSPVHKPSPRGFAAAAYDGARKNIVLFGGRLANNTISDETWTWDGKDWTQHDLKLRPDARRNASMVYDAHRKVVVMFGGRKHLADIRFPEDTLNDTWTWDGSTWKIMSREGAPWPRHSAAMAYDLCRAEAVMFGGHGPTPPTGGFDPAPGQTWTWDGAKWANKTPQLPGVSPPARMGASAVYTPRTGRVLLYGGLSVTDTGDKTAATDPHLWMWDGAAWSMEESDPVLEPTIGVLTPDKPLTNGGPKSRAYASLVIDTTGIPRQHGRIHLYGGTPAIVEQFPLTMQPSQQVALGDQYRYSEASFYPTLTLGVINNGSCPNPVPIPPDGEAVPAAPAPAPEGDEAPAATRAGLQEIGRIPVLLGTPWPANNRNTRIGSGSSATPNPNYTPAPACPRRIGTTELALNTHLATDAKRNRIYQFYSCDPDRGRKDDSQVNPRVSNLLIQAYDGATLKPLGSVVVTLPSESSIPYGYLPLRLLHDQERGRFLIPIETGAGNVDLWIFQQDLIEKGADPVVEKVAKPFPLPNAWGLGFFNHPKTGRAKLLYPGAACSSTGGTGLNQTCTATIAQLDLQNRQNDWVAQVPGCPTTSYQRPARSVDRVYVVCQDTSGGKGYVARIPTLLAADGSETPGTAEVFGGRFVGVRESWFDPQTERMSIIAGHNTVTLYVFDGKASRMVGRASVAGTLLDHKMGFGFDQETGRVYALVDDVVNPHVYNPYRLQGGLMMVDTRLTPVAQALNFPQYMRPGQVPIATLSPAGGVPRRVLVRGAYNYTPSDPGDQAQVSATQESVQKYPDGETIRFPDQMHYLVLADEVPVPETSDLAELDALTIPVAEAPGKTEVSFEAEGGAYGIRLRSTGGIWSALRPPQQMFEGNWEILIDSTITTFGRPVLPACVFPDRELVAGWVPGARLSDLDAVARSSGLEVDSNSKVDLVGPFTRCDPPLGPSDLPPSAKPVTDLLWPLRQMAQAEGNEAAAPNLKWSKFFSEVECVGNAANSTQTTGVDVSGSANCNQKDGQVTGTARSALGPAAANAVFSVGEGSSSVVVSRDPIKGVVVTATAVAKGIQLPGLTIGYVTTTAVAWSNGRPGAGRASFTREICNIKPPLPVNPANFNDSAPSTGCLTENQQKALVKNWNDRWGINSKMILPTYDPDLYQGSPGGYIAGVIKPVAEELDDQLFAKDFQREVPGLVIVFYKDSRASGPAQQSLQLAAVRAVTGFGVQCASDLVYSSSSNSCVALTFEDDPLVEEFEEDEELSEDDTAFSSYDDAEGWAPVAAAPERLELGQRLGRFIQNLPIIRQLPIRQMGEALLAASVWLLLGLPLLFAGRRLTINLGRNN